MDNSISAPVVELRGFSVLDTITGPTTTGGSVKLSDNSERRTGPSEGGKGAMAQLVLQHMQAPESFANMSETDLALGIDPRQTSTGSAKGGSQPLTSRMDKIEAYEMKRHFHEDRDYLLHRLKKKDVYV